MAYPILQGATPTLQGGTSTIQGSSPTLQGSVSPPKQTTIAPTAPQPTTTVKAPTTYAAPTVQAAQPDSSINSIFSPYIGSRPSPSSPGTLEYYNKQTGQGFATQQQLFSFASSLGAGTIGSFDQLHAPVTSTQTQGIQPLTDPSASFARSAGTAGLSPDEYLKLVQGQNALTPDEIAQIRGGLGIDQLENLVFTPPSQTTEQLYNSAYSSAGLADVKAKILDLNNRISQRQQQYTDAEGTINENPFLSEASRVGRVSRLRDKAQQEIGNLLDEQKQYQDLYQNGLKEIEGLVTRHTTDFTQEQTLNAQKLQYLLSKAEQQATATLAKKNQASYSYLPDYLAAKSKATAPTTFSAGNGASFYYDKASGTFVQISGPTSGFTSVTGVDGSPIPFNAGTGQFGSSGSVSIPQNTLAFRNNNPGNLRYVGQPGATQGEGGFARFSTPEAGYQALISQIQLDSSRGLTLSQFINKYAPPSENNTAQYIQQAISATGATANTPISQIDINKLAQFMAKKESGTSISAGQSSAVIDSLVEQVRKNPALLATLPENYQKAIIAKLAGSGTSVPSTKQATDTQNQAATYATRVQQAGNVLDGLESGIASYNPIGFEAQLKLPSYLQSSQIQQYMQAARNLVNAILRRESGAAISSGEFENAYAQYLPKPGDSAATLAQKKQNRNTILQGLVQSSGPATSQALLQTDGSTKNVDLSGFNFSF